MQTLTYFPVLLLFVACTTLGFGGSSWKEEVLLHDGSKIVVSRSVSRGGPHEIGQQGTYQEQTLTFTMPGSGRSVKWEDHRSNDIGSSNFLPMLLDVYGDAAYLAVSPMGCLSYNKWGRPNPPYVVFKYDSTTWRQIALVELPSESKAVNLIFSMPDFEVEKAGKRFMSVEMIKAIVSDYQQPEYRSILRESVKGKGSGVTSCLAMLPDGNGGWIWTDSFRHSTREECLEFCARKKIAADYCKCSISDKGNRSP